jgi:hypothetical protein
VAVLVPANRCVAEEGPTYVHRTAERLLACSYRGFMRPFHWRGMHQGGTNEMDGVPGITGPVIAPGAEFVP